jgi:hypothetical protein
MTAVSVVSLRPMHAWDRLGRGRPERIGGKGRVFMVSLVVA